MNNIQLEKLSLDDLNSLLREVKLYKQLRTQLGNRGKVLFHNMKNGKNTLVVEYFNAVGIDLAWEEAEKIYTKVFQIKVEKNDVVFIENNHLKGGIKVYKNDLMVDMSYRKVEIQMGK